LEKLNGFISTLKCTALSFAGAIALFSTLAARPAFSQPVAHLSVTLAGPGQATPPAGITFGSTATYTVVITNAGPSNATGVQLNATLPAGTRLSSIGSNCRPVNNDGKFPCSVGTIDDFTSVTVSFVLSLPVPTPYPTTCPATTSLGNTSVAVTSTSIDPNPVENTASVTNTVRLFADMAVTLTGPSSANQGDTVTYQIVATNKGPCPAAGVSLRSTPSGGIIFQSNSGDCAAEFPCAFGVMNPGATKSVTSTFIIDQMPKELRQTGDPNSVNVRSTTDDPIPSNNSATVNTLVVNNAGCSSTGGSATGLAGLVLLLVFAANRRRSA
jgi:uncharacterized repeat protein (TIGR01451 family)/uncharacterized protein (TIGR03382 family)